MPLTKMSDIAMHEAGHTLIIYLMSDLVELYHVTIDEEYSKTIDKHSGGGVLYKHLKSPEKLQPLERDQFCLSFLGGLAADLVNEHNGAVAREYLFSEHFPAKIEHFHYQGDMIAYDLHFSLFQRMLKVEPAHYNFISIYFLTEFFSRAEILPVLLAVRDLIEKSKTVSGYELNTFLDQSYLGNWKATIWQKVKDDRKILFFP